MRVFMFLKFNALCNLCFGLMLLFIPGWMMALYGVSLDAGGVYLARMVGAAYLGYAVITWLSSELSEEQLHAVILPGLLIWFAVGLLALLYGQFSGVTNFLGWFTALLSAFFVAGYAYFLTRPVDKTSTKAVAGKQTGLD